MPDLEFKGKQFIYAHHLTVPYRPLVPDDAKSLNPAGADDNLIIHGDNLHALKALLPRYAGRVRCIYIDPPYNTGNEGWVYNDRVNSPLMKEWLKDSIPVDFPQPFGAPINLDQEDDAILQQIADLRAASGKV